MHKNEMRLFHLVSEVDGEFIVGGVHYPNDYVHVCWNATQNMHTTKHAGGSFESMAWFLAIHGRGAVIRYLDEINQTSK